MSNMAHLKSDSQKLVPESMYYRNSVPKTLMMQRSDSNSIRSVPKKWSMSFYFGHLWPVS